MRNRHPVLSLVPVGLLVLTTSSACRDAGTAPAGPPPSQARLQVTPGLVVNTLTDDGDGTCTTAKCTLRDAIAKAPANETISFSAGLTGTIRLDALKGELLIERGVTIMGPGLATLAVSGGDTIRVFQIAARGAAVTISGLTITDGFAMGLGGALYHTTGNLTLAQVAVTSSRASWPTGRSYGGGISTSGLLTVEQSTISGNSASVGGGIVAFNGLTLSESTVSANSATEIGGGVAAGVDAQDLGTNSTTIVNSTISGNTAAALGAGIYNVQGPMRILLSTITSNHVGSGGSGGGVWSSNNTDTRTDVKGTIIWGNTAGDLSTPDDVAAGSTVQRYNSLGYNLIGATSANVDFALEFTQEGDQTGVVDAKLGLLESNGGPTRTHALLSGSPAINAGTCTDHLAATVATDQRGTSRPQPPVTLCDVGAYEAEPPRDATPPVITPNIAGTLGSNGWYTSNVIVSWSVSDKESAVTSGPCAPTTISADTPGREVTCGATSAGGASSQTVTIKRDAAAPSLSPAVAPKPVFLNGAATATPNATDAISGVASSSCGVPSTASVGPKTVACTATDNAGNSASASAAYAVTYQFVGFSEPVDGGSVMNVAKAQKNIPLKWRLLDAAGTPVTTLMAATVSAANLACTAGTTADALEEYASGGPGLRNLGNGYYQFSWATPKGFAGSCQTMQLDLGEGATHNAMFQFTK